MNSKYIKVKSVSWWSGIGMIITAITGYIQTQDFDTNSKIFMIGAAAIGLRGAID